MFENPYVRNIAYMYVCLFESWLFSIRDIIRLIPTEWMFAYIETCSFGYMFAIMFLCIFKYQTFKTKKQNSNVFTCMFACLYVCMRACLYTCMFVYMYDCILVWLYTCMFVCLYYNFCYFLLSILQCFILFESLITCMFAR